MITVQVELWTILIENSISQLVLDDPEDWVTKDEEISYYIFSRVPKKPPAPPSRQTEVKQTSEAIRQREIKQQQQVIGTSAVPQSAVPKNICTVEELERGLLNNRVNKTQPHVPPQIQRPLFPVSNESERIGRLEYRDFFFFVYLFIRVVASASTVATFTAGDSPPKFTATDEEYAADAAAFELTAGIGSYAGAVS